MPLFVVLISCTSTTILPPDHSGEVVIFGEGGGFAGRETGYAILDNGQVFEMDHNRHFKRREDLDRSKARQLFENIELLGLIDRPFMEPGNIYHFIEVRRDQKETRISWNDVTGNAPDDVMTFYKVLRSHVE